MTTTPNYSFTLPTIGGDQNTWGNELNANWTSVDSILHTLASTPYLPIGGGTLTGALGVGGNGIRYTTFGTAYIGFNWDGTNLYAAANGTTLPALATQSYVSGAYLPLTGGALSSTLSVGGNGIRYTGYGGTHYIGFTWDGTNIYAAEDGTTIGAMATQSWANSHFLPLSGSSTLTGSLSLSGTSSNLVVGGNIYSDQAVYVANGSVGDFYLARSGGNRMLNWANNYYQYYQESNGQISWVQNSTTTMSLTTAGELYISGYLLANDHVQINGNGIAYAKYATNQVGWQWTGATLNCLVDNSVVGNVFSDIRVKDVAGAYEHGLAEICQLQPVRYTLKGNDRGITSDDAEQARILAGPSIHDTTKVRVGVVAQDAETVMPELFRTASVMLDGERADDVRLLDDGPWLQWALVNAIKELAAEVSSLKAQLRA